MMTTNLFVIANVKQLRTNGSFRILLPFFWTSWGVGVLNSTIFNSFHNRVEFGTILEGLQNFGGAWTPQTRPRCTTEQNMINVKWSRYRPGVAQRMGRGIALLFHDHGTRKGWVVSSTPRLHFTPGKEMVPIVQEAGRAPGPVWTGSSPLGLQPYIIYIQWYLGKRR